jgi:archaeal chaperonin
MSGISVSGKEAYRQNILAARAIAETVRSTLGPKGMDKMVVAKDGSSFVTNDGVTILEGIELAHPTAKMIVEASRTQDDGAGDGTTTVVVLAGELLKEAEILLQSGVHPSIIIRGFRLAQDRALALLKDLSQPILKHKERALTNIAITAMSGKGVGESRQKLAALAVEACFLVPQNPRESIKLLSIPGGRIDEASIVQGVVLQKTRVRESMVSEVKSAKIALINAPIELRQTEANSKVTISSPEQMQGFIQMEDNMLKELVLSILKTGANVVVCQKGIDDIAQQHFEAAGVYALRRVSLSDMRLLSKATGGRIITEISQIRPADLGKADRVHEQKVGEERLSFFSSMKGCRALSLLVRGSTPQVADEALRAFQDAIGDIAAVLEDGRLLGGAGATELELSFQLFKYAEGLPGREQLAVKGFAKALEIIPVSLAENAGLDQLSAITALKAAHSKGQSFAGLNVENGKPLHTFKEGIIEPLRVKTLAISSAVEVATMILRIDEVIENEQQPPNAPVFE